MVDPKIFAELKYEDFKNLATNLELSKYERIGFPDSYRAGKEEEIFSDICFKLPKINESKKLVIDIGPGCSELPILISNLCKEKNHSLLFIDSEEMLNQLPDGAHISKLAAFFPKCKPELSSYIGKTDVIVCYSVLHYIFIETSLFEFLDTALSLLAPGGQFLIGDIPNVSKRKRFFASENGIAFHKEFMKTTEKPAVSFNQIEEGQIDDSVVNSILSRARLQGFDAYIMPQQPNLPMANRREDILIFRP